MTFTVPDLSKTDSPLGPEITEHSCQVIGPHSPFLHDPRTPWRRHLLHEAPLGEVEMQGEMQGRRGRYCEDVIELGGSHQESTEWEVL